MNIVKPVDQLVLPKPRRYDVALNRVPEEPVIPEMIHKVHEIQVYDNLYAKSTQLGIRSI